MRSNSVLVCALLFACLSIPSSHGQDSLDLNSVHVEITTSKKYYAVGEPIRFRAVLVNRGSTPFWIPKSLSAGGGIAGFAVTVKQLAGKPPHQGCGYGLDRWPGKDPRSGDQILKEDFRLLPPGGMVRYEDRYAGCEVVNPGQYRITADYVTWDINQEKVESVTLNGAGVLKRGTYHSAPITFTVR